MTKGKWGRRCVFLVVALIAGSYYRWQAHAATGPFLWGYDLDGHYNFLAQAFAHGHLYLPIEPSPLLLALSNPYDPTVDNSIRRADMVLYHGRYYLYFGAGPAVMLFTPWRLITGHDLPENFAAFLLCFGGFLFACGALLRVLDLAGARPKLWVLALLLLGLAFCQSVPYLLNRVAVYEIAIGSGYFCLAGAVFFLARGLPLEARASWRWLAASGLMFGLAVACRPHLILASVVAAAALALYGGRTGWRAPAAFLAAWMFAGAGISAYNFERFGNPVEFGVRYQLAGVGQNRIELAPRNLEPGLYYMLLSRPQFSRTFPWMRMVFRFPFDSADRHPLPPEYFVEPTVGALWLAPFLIAAFWVPSARRLARVSKGARATEVRTVLWSCSISAAAILLFLMSTHLATHRYEVDFLPLAVFAALANLGIRAGTGSSRSRFLLYAALVLVIGYSAAANLALGIAGPYDDILRYQPAWYVGLARRFSPTFEFRPLLNPGITVDLAAEFIPEPAGFREPLITIGHSHHDYFLYAEHGRGMVRLISQSEGGRASYDVPDPIGRQIRVGLSYAPQSKRIVTTMNGQKVMEVPAPTIVAAPAQVTIGENFNDLGLTYRRFTGRLAVLDKTIREP